MNVKIPLGFVMVMLPALIPKVAMSVCVTLATLEMVSCAQVSTYLIACETLIFVFVIRY